MSDQELIPTVQVPSGSKFVNDKGIRAIKNGVKASQNKKPQNILRKPAWLRIKAHTDKRYGEVKKTVKDHKLSTVCEEAMCPNINECWSSGTATIMLMGDVCTRACKFCAVNTGNPKGLLDEKEPENTADTVGMMGLKYLVLTSVNRDDIEDGGAAHYAAVVKAVIEKNPNTTVEALTPDFLGNLKDVETVVDSGIAVFAQNVETVRRLTHPVRDPRASYEMTLEVLEHAKKHNPNVLTKTSIMLGLGETEDEILEAMDDLRAIGVDILTFGQYLQPTKNHIALQRYVTPEEFEKYRQWGLDKGFLEVVSGALVRSSYRAEQVLEKNNVGLGHPPNN
ncbi:lipoyl synthase [Sansalvadorimonas sp. 2012CJ34-2]|uniref:Lipoyl synthase n=1 Tax=Parendozoicomonas callyspongiae TaxID=2942213 RepID=A0ABT0PCM3_9GAMM|nr:lipoyl synthase [Sansalvadorimonas sp. 2012CJ34-2]MCL6269132.1 lipoyl synthase [Sansalvadorimonas sp. 2012CJ34-2]